MDTTTATTTLKEPNGHALVHAGFASRMIAFILDLVIMCLILLVAGVFVQLVGLYFPLNRLLAQIPGLGVGDTLRTSLVLAFTIAVFSGYPVFFWTMMGQTPGKWTLGLRVVRTDGRSLTVWRSILRYLAYWLSALPLFLGFIWIIFDAKRQGWHDKIADTSVIYTARPARRTARLPAAIRQ